MLSVVLTIVSISFFAVCVCVSCCIVNSEKKYDDVYFEEENALEKLEKEVKRNK